MTTPNESRIVLSNPVTCVTDPPEGALEGAEGQIVYCVKTKDLWLKRSPSIAKTGWKRLAFFSEITVEYS